MKAFTALNSKCIMIWAVFTCGLLGLPTFVWAAETPPAAPPPAPATAIHRTPTPPRIDGVLDDACWKEAVPITAGYIFNRTGVLSPEPRMQAKFAWDAHYLYIGYETKTPNVRATGTGRKDGPPENQRECIDYSDTKSCFVEIFISFGNPTFFWELHHNAANQFDDVLCFIPAKTAPDTQSTLLHSGLYFADKEYIADDPPYTFQSATALRKETPAAAADRPPAEVKTVGWTGELRVPWTGLGPAAGLRTWQKDGERKTALWNMADQRLQILCVITTTDLWSPYMHSSPTFKGGWFHYGMQDWPQYLLNDKRP